jgi:hypothetical protein
MLQCNGCIRFINPERGPQLKVGLRRTVRDRFGNEIIAEIKCQDCVDKDGVPGLPDQEATGTGAA